MSYSPHVWVYLNGYTTPDKEFPAEGESPDVFVLPDTNEEWSEVLNEPLKILSAEKKAESLAVCGAKFAAGATTKRQTADNLVCSTALVLDVDFWRDDRPPFTYVDIQQCLAGTRFICWTTWSSTKEKRKWRVVVPLASEMPTVFYKSLFTLLNETLQSTISSTLNDPGRLGFFGSAKSKEVAKQFEWHINEGDRLDWTVLDLAQEALPTETDLKTADFDETELFPYAMRVEKARRYCAKRHEDVGEGGRHDRLLSTGCLLWWDFALEKDAVRELLLELNSRFSLPKDDQDVERDLEASFERTLGSKRVAQEGPRGGKVLRQKPKKDDDSVDESAEDLSRTDKGVIRPSVQNDAIAVRELYGSDLKHNLLTDCVEITTDGETVEMFDTQEHVIAGMVDKVFHYSRPVQAISDAIRRVAHEKAYNPLQDYLHAIEWDGVSRFDALGAAIGAEDTLSKQYLRKWMMSAVARALDPGCKADCMLILKGLQGTKKSTFASVLGGSWYFEKTTPIGGDNKDGLLQLVGSWIVEMPELAAFGRRNANDLKSFLSTLTDRFRSPFARNMANRKRSCVFIGTTNQDSFLADDTGNRRFWVVDVTKSIDIKWIKEHRDQLWAESVHAYKQAAKEIAAGNETHAWWLNGDEAVRHKEQAELYAVKNPIEDSIVAAAYSLWKPVNKDKFNEFKVVEIYKRVSGTDDETRFTAQMKREYNKILRDNGFISRDTRRNGAKVDLWRPADAPLPENAP